MKKVDRIAESDKLRERVLALESIAAFTAPLNEDAGNIINDMLKEYIARLKFLCSAKEYMCHFEGGGWNTCYGRDEEEAFANAEIEHNKEEVDGYAALKVKSVSLATKAGKEIAMRLFY